MIEIIYRATVYYDNVISDKTEEDCWAFAYKYKEIEFSQFGGCPACDPYFTIEGKDRAKVEQLTGKIFRRLARHKNLRVYY